MKPTGRTAWRLAPVALALAVLWAGPAAAQGQEGDDDGDR